MMLNASVIIEDFYLFLYWSKRTSQAFTPLTDFSLSITRRYTLLSIEKIPKDFEFVFSVFFFSSVSVDWSL